MTRDFQNYGPFIVKVKGGAHLQAFDRTAEGFLGTQFSGLVELGLTDDNVRIIPKFTHRDVNVNEFGGTEGPPAEILAMPSEVVIVMNLIHLEPDILDLCYAESQGGPIGTPVQFPAGNLTFLGAGALPSAGSPLGANLPLFSSGCHHISLNLIPSESLTSLPYRFRACHIISPGTEITVGTKTSVYGLQWRCIPYPQFTTTVFGVPITVSSLSSSGAVISSGLVLYDRTADT